MSVQWGGGSHKTGHVNGVWSQPPVFPALPEPFRNQKPPEIKTQRDLLDQSKVPGSEQGASWTRRGQKPASLPTGSTRGEQRSPPAGRQGSSAGRARDAAETGRLPGSAQGHPLAAPADRSPTARSAPWCRGLASPRPQGVACGARARGQRKEGGQRMGRLSPGEGREAGPYLIAEDAVRLGTPGRHGGSELGLARGLQAERQQPARSGRV